MKYNIHDIRAQFPVLNTKVHGNKSLIYLDNAATNQKPISVIEALTDYYQSSNANIHRGIHFLAEKATGLFEQTRTRTQQFLNSRYTEEIIFTKGTTEGINLIARCMAPSLQKGDEIVISTLEHHSNIVPWQIICEERGSTLKVIPINEAGEINIEEYKKLLSDKTKVVSVTHVSNALGSINPIKEMAALAHSYGAYFVADGAQAVAHLDIDVQDLDVDFYVFSGHKLYGPTGTGVLFGKKEILESLPPYQGGGEMIKEVTFEKTTYNELPYKYEAGTPNIADVVALYYAIEFVEGIGKKNIAEHEHQLLIYATDELKKLSQLRIIGEAQNKSAVISFVFDDIHHQDIGILLDNMGIAIRTGHHCTQPLMSRLGVTGTNRASFAAYNTSEEVDMFVAGLNKVISMVR